MTKRTFGKIERNAKGSLMLSTKRRSTARVNRAGQTNINVRQQIERKALASERLDQGTWGIETKEGTGRVEELSFVLRGPASLLATPRRNHDGCLHISIA